MTNENAAMSEDLFTRYLNVRGAYIATDDAQTEDAIADILDGIWRQMTTDQRERVRTLFPLSSDRNVVNARTLLAQKDDEIAMLRKVNDAALVFTSRMREIYRAEQAALDAALESAKRDEGEGS